MAIGGALLTVVSTSSTVIPTEAKSSMPATPVASHPACQDQTWPYLSDACLRRDQTPAANQPAHVRLLGYDTAMANAAIGATPWAAVKETLPNRPSRGRGLQARSKRTVQQEANPGQPQTRTVVVRSGRNGQPERVYVVPSDAYGAYGYAPR